MHVFCDDALVISGAHICDIAWFVVDRESLLLASATADATRLTRDGRQQRSEGREGESETDGEANPYDGTAKQEKDAYTLDFSLYNATAAAINDKTEVVDYAFLSATPQPSRVAGESLAVYQTRLKRWMEACYRSYLAVHLSDLLRGASPALLVEFESLTKRAAEAGDTRAVRGIVAPARDDTGDHFVWLDIPVLLTQSKRMYESLHNVAVLYCKLSHATWKPSYSLTSVETRLKLQYRAVQPAGKAVLLSEHVELQICDAAAGDDAAESMRPLLHHLVDMHNLPQLSTAADERSGILSHLPRLEQALFRRLREPLLRMKLFLGLSADFGTPVDLRVGGGGNEEESGWVMTVTYCVVDRTTLRSFTVVLRCVSGEEVPSVETRCVSCDGALPSTTFLLRSVLIERAETMRRDVEGFLDVEELRMAVVHATLDSMAACSKAPS